MFNSSIISLFILNIIILFVKCYEPFLQLNITFQLFKLPCDKASNMINIFNFEYCKYFCAYMINFYSHKRCSLEIVISKPFEIIMYWFKLPKLLVNDRNT